MTPKLTMSAPVLTSSPFPSPLLTPSSYSSSLSSSLPPSPKTSEKSSKIIIKISKSCHIRIRKTGCSAQSCKGDSDFQIAMKPFHLSPILADLMTFENGVNNNYTTIIIITLDQERKSICNRLIQYQKSPIPLVVEKHGAILQVFKQSCFIRRLVVACFTVFFYV